MDSGESIVTEAIYSGLGSLLMEELAPNSASIISMIGAGIVLTRAVQKPHRKKILSSIYKVYKKRRLDILQHYKQALADRSPVNVANYEYLAASAWAAIKVDISEAKGALLEIISAGWGLTKVIEPNSISAIAACVLVEAADSPARLKRRDIWAFRSFEPLAAIGTSQYISLSKTEGFFKD